MNKSIKIIISIIIVIIMLVCAYLLGTTQAETITEVQTVINTVEVIPEGYIPLDECIPLSDIACYFIDGYDYPCFELGDYTHQFDDDNNRSYKDIMDELVNETEDFKKYFIDMRAVIDYSVSEYGLQLYFEDGTGYWLE